MRGFAPASVGATVCLAAPDPHATRDASRPMRATQARSFVHPRLVGSRSRSQGFLFRKSALRAGADRFMTIGSLRRIAHRWRGALSSPNVRIVWDRASDTPVVTSNVSDACKMHRIIGAPSWLPPCPHDGITVFPQPGCLPSDQEVSPQIWLSSPPIPPFSWRFGFRRLYARQVLSQHWAVVSPQLARFLATRPLLPLLRMASRELLGTETTLVDFCNQNDAQTRTRNGSSSPAFE
jgi:hypothetical protein